MPAIQKIAGDVKCLPYPLQGYDGGIKTLHSSDTLGKELHP